MKPRTNLGERSQITFAGFLLIRRAAPASTRSTERRDADEHVCESFTITPSFIAGSLMTRPAATTEPLVSASLSHAPPTGSGMPKCFTAQGISTIIGSATINRKSRRSFLGRLGSRTPRWPPTPQIGDRREASRRTRHPRGAAAP